MRLATRPLATAPLAGAVVSAHIQPAGALSLRQNVAQVQSAGMLTLQQTVGTLQAAGALALQQQVLQLQPAGALVLRQQVQRIQPAGQLHLLQRVITQGSEQPYQRTHIPPCYVLINGKSFTGAVSIHGLNISQAEDANATASFFVFFERDIEIFVPSFFGKPVQILAHTDLADIASPLIPYFTGTVSSARHDHARRGIQFECSDLRDERLARENPDELRGLTGAVYSNVTQQEDAKDADYVQELMKTAIGSLGYTRAGELQYYSWGATGKPVDWTLHNKDVHYRDLSTDFQTRADIKNSVTINMQYRWHRTNRFMAFIKTQRPRIISHGDGTYDLQTFAADSMADRANSFAPWETTSYRVIPATAVVQANAYSGDPNKPSIAEVKGSALKARAVGFEAELERRVAQPVTESYTVKLTCPQSIDAYGEEIPGSDLSWSITHEYDRAAWEENGRTLGADTKRGELALAWQAGLLIGKKELVQSHRNNYITLLLRQRLLPAEIGQIVTLDTRIVSVTGQIVGLTWSIDDGIRDTQVRIAVSYMDTDLTAPAENLTPPHAPNIQGVFIQGMQGKSAYIDGRLEASAPEISDDYTDEKEVDVPERVIEVALENNIITLINGH